MAILCEGHIILEDFPGVGKTMLAKSLARSLDCEFARVQATPDLLPSDVTGVSVFNLQGNEFEFKPGPVFANLVLVDEINRASPKTQSALLECMQEVQVTVDGVTHPLARPFMVIATQNPIEYEGTFPLPEAQLDRFTMRLTLGYPDARQEARMLSEHAAGEPLDELRPVATAADIESAIAAVKSIFVEESLHRYVVAILNHTRSDTRLVARREPAGGHLAAAGREGARGARGARLRLAGRREGGRRGRALAPRHPRARGAHGRHRRGRLDPRGARAHGHPGMTTRGRRLLLLAAGLYLVSWGFGTAVMFPVAVGLALAPLAALGWVKALDRPMLLRRRTGHLELTEGQSVDVGLEVRPDTGGPMPGRAILRRPARQHACRRGRAGAPRPDAARPLRDRAGPARPLPAWTAPSS